MRRSEKIRVVRCRKERESEVSGGGEAADLLRPHFSREVHRSCLLLQHWLRQTEAETLQHLGGQRASKPATAPSVRRFSFSPPFIDGSRTTTPASPLDTRRDTTPIASTPTLYPLLCLLNDLDLSLSHSTAASEAGDVVLISSSLADAAATPYG